MAEPVGVVVAQVSPRSSAALELIEALDDELGRRYPGAVIEGLLPEDDTDRLIFLVARFGDRPAACGAVRLLAALEAEAVASGNPYSHCFEKPLI